MANKYHSDKKYQITQLLVNQTPGDTGNIEAATKTITATAEGASPDYTSASLAMASLITPADARLRVLRIATRASITIDSDDGTHDLRCRVYIDTQDADHLLFDLTFTTVGNQIAVQCLTAATKAILFNLLNAGAAHVYKFFFWSPGNHSPVISVVQAWECIGGNSSTGFGSDGWIMTFDSGPCFWQIFQSIRLLGATGLPSFRVYPYFQADLMYDCVGHSSAAADYATVAPYLSLTAAVIHYRCKSTVATSIAYISQGMIQIMTEI